MTRTVASPVAKDRTHAKPAEPRAASPDKAVAASPARARVCPCDGGCPRCACDALGGSGRALDAQTRGVFESKFERDLSGVRIHEGPAANAAARVLRAQAFASGNDIAWPGSAPHMASPQGQRLLAHELTHVVQQQGGGSSAAGSAIAEREARDAAASIHSGATIQATPTRVGIAYSPEEWLTKSPDVSALSYTELKSEIDQIHDWQSRQTTTSDDSIRLDEVLAELQTEFNRREKKARATQLQKPVTKKQKAAAAADPIPVRETPRPRVLSERSSFAYDTPEEMREEVDNIVAWLQRPDVSKADRQILHTELGNLSPQINQDRAVQAAKRRGEAIQNAISPPSSLEDARTQSFQAIQRIDAIKALSDGTGYALQSGSEMIVLSEEEVITLKSSVNHALDEAAKQARSMNEYTFGRGQAFLDLNYNEHPVVGFLVSRLTTKDPADVWEDTLPKIQASNMAVTAFQQLGANATLSAKATKVFDAVEKAEVARLTLNEGIDDAETSAGKIVTGLQITEKVSFTIALSLGAIAAAPLVAAGVAGAGLTGAGALGATAIGTGTVVGAGGFVLGGTAGMAQTAVAGGSTSDILSAGWSQGKDLAGQGFTIGLGAGAGAWANAALKVGAPGLSLASNFARSTAASTFGNVVGSSSEAIRQGKGALEVLKSGGTAALTSVALSPFNFGASQIANPGLRTAANMLVGGGGNFATTYYLGDHDFSESLQSAAIGAVSAYGGSLQNEGASPEALAKATAAGKSIRNSVRGVGSLGRNLAMATMLGSAQVSSSMRGMRSQLTSQVEPDTANTSGAVSGSPPATDTRSDFDRNVDQAFAEDAQYQTSSDDGFQLRKRTTNSGKRFTSLSTLALTRDQLRAAGRLVGQRLSGGHLSEWNNAANADEVQDMVEVRRLWGVGTDASKQQARDLARIVFDRHVSRFWNAVRGNPALRADYTAAGMRFDLTKTGAPRYQLPTGEETGITLDHNTRLMDDPTQALSGNNLSAVLGDENSVTLEDIRNNDPFQP